MAKKRRDPVYSKAVGKRLAAAREAVKLTQRECAPLAGVTPAAWSNWETGTNLLDVQGAARFVAAVAEADKDNRLSLDWFFRADLGGTPHRLAQEIERWMQRLKD